MNADRIDPVAALEIIRQLRRPQDIVVTTMGSARDWMELGAGPLDLVFVPSAMGHATSVGLGLAIAQPERRVFVCNGDGSMLMNLGSLVTIASEAPPNLTIVLFDNGVYEVTGAQPTPRGAVGVDFSGIARASGIVSSHHSPSLGEFSTACGAAIERPGPHFFALDVAQRPGQPGPKSPGKAGVRSAAFMKALGTDAEPTT